MAGSTEPAPPFDRAWLGRATEDGSIPGVRLLHYASVSWLRSLDALPLLARGAAFFAFALLLALLEVQIEGSHGWAAKLPTWRWDSPFVRRLLGRPITGYHVFLILLILLAFHLPLLYAGWTWPRHAELLAFFFFLTVFWDLLWFLLNPHFGWARFRPAEIWWFPNWWGRFPAPYYQGLVVSFGIWISADFCGRRAAQWGLLLAEFVALTLAATLLCRRRCGTGADRV